MLITPRRALCAATAVLAAAAVVVGSSASAQAPAGRTLTFKELDKGSTFTHVRNTKGASRQSNHQGDVLAFTAPLADASGRRAGKLFVSCITTVGARNFLKSTLTCTGVVELADGTLTLAVNFSPGSSTTSGAVTGGNGAYAGARGVFVSNDAASGGSEDVITLLG
jgi:hypothetical protein